MHDSHYLNTILRNPIKNAEREFMNKTSSGFRVDFRPCIGMGNYALDCCIHFLGEPEPKSGLTLLIILNSRKKLFFSSFMKTVIHFVKLCFIFPKTSSPGISLDLPLSRDLDRDSTSAAHA